MEVISLGLLALASGGLLAKVRADKAKANKKEGFTATQDTLFGNVQQRTLPQLHKDYVAKTDSYFNPFASLLNINKTNVDFITSNADASWTYSAPDNKTSANLFRSVYSKATPNGYAIDDNLGEKKATPYRVPLSTDIGGVINTCENVSVRTTDPLVADCSVFQGGFKNVCGICHGGVPGTGTANLCSNSTGKPIDTPAGLFVSSRLKTEPSQEQLQMDSLISGGNLTSMLVTPTLGTCSIDPKTNKNLFSLSSNTCVANNNYLKCAVRQGFEASKNCYACSTDGKFYFVDDVSGNFAVRQPTTFTLGGNGTVTIELLDTNGTTSLGYLSMPTSGSFLNLTSSSSSITLRPGSNGMTPWQIPLSNGNAAAGKYLSITLTGTSSVPYVQGVFKGNLRTNNPGQYTDFAVTAYDMTTGTSNNVFYESSSYGMKLEPAVIRGAQGLTAIFKVLIPYLYINTSNIEANYCAGPYVVNSNSKALLSNSPCYASDSGPGNYNLECLQRVFISGGCTTQGSGYPSNTDKANVLMSRARSNVGSNANQGEIANYVYSEYRRSWSGLDSNGVQLSPSNWNASQKFCTDSNAAIINPCDNLPPYVKENGPLSDECINYIYTSGYAGDSNNGTYSTYSGNTQAASLFGATEPFIGSSKKDRWCTELGIVSPLQGGPNMAVAKDKGGIAALKSFYNNIHMKANQTDMKNAERAQYVAQCYGTTMNIQGDADPTVKEGIPTSATNCGTAGLTSANRSSDQDQGNIVGSGSIGNIRFVRVYGNGSDYLQISQLVVLDSRGQNLALKKNTSYNSITGPEDSLGSATAVDGTLSIRNAPNIYHSSGYGPNEYFEVDLGGLYDIVQIIYFNRTVVQFRATGTKIYLYDNETFLTNTVRSKNNARYVSDPLTAAPVQYINLANPNGDVSCPKMLSGQRGDLFAGQTTNNGIRNNVGSLITDLTPYAIYNLSLSSDMSLNLGGDSISGTTTAKWIWNHPYATQGARNETVGFYTNIYNTTNIPKNYYLYYRCDDAVTAIFFNGVSLPSVPGGAYTGNTVGSKVLLVALPGQNIVKVQCANYAGRACFIAAIYDSKVLEWVSKTDAGLTNYYSATNAASTSSGGYSWRSYSEPNIGTVFQNNATVYTIHRITEKPGGWNTTTTNSMQWIWNQPDAGQYAEQGSINFYINFNVTSITVVYYKLFFACDDAITSFTINGMTVPSTSINSSSSDVNNVTFQVVFGTNCLQITVGNYGNNPAGFKAYIVDNSNNFVTGTQTDSGNSSLWKCSTETQWSLGNACVYVPSGGMTYNCASNIWGSNCSQGFTNAIFTGNPTKATNGGGLDNYNKGNMGAELNDRWGNNSLAYGSNASERARQTACRGTTVCPNNYYYNTTNDAAAGRCVPNGVADNAICPSGYTYGSGFDDKSCSRTTNIGLRTVALPSTFPAKACSELNEHAECGTRNGGTDYSPSGDGCHWSRNNICHGSCSTCDCGWVTCRNLSRSKSYADRISGLSCPVGTTEDPSRDSGNTRAPKLCIPNAISDLPQRSGHACGYTVTKIAFSSQSYLQISQIAAYDIYGDNLIQTEPWNRTVTGSTPFGDSSIDKPVDGSIEARNWPNIYHSASENNNSYIIDFYSARNIVGIVYCNRKDSDSGRAVSMTMKIYNGNTVVFSKTPSISPFTDGMVQYVSLRRSEACQPYYENCPSGTAQQANGTCIGKTSPTNFTNRQLPN